jgi:hypothetical protein
MLAARGAIIMAQRHFPDRVELLVRPAIDSPYRQSGFLDRFAKPGGPARVPS